MEAKTKIRKLKNGCAIIQQKMILLKEMLFQEARLREKQVEMEKLHPSVQFGLGAFADNQCSFRGSVNLAASVKVRGCSIGPNTYLSTNTQMMNCDIGSYCSIGANVLAGLGTHPVKSFVSTHPFILQ